MNNLLEKIKSRSLAINEQRNVFLLKVENLNDILAESLAGIDVWARSEKECLEMIGLDDWIYGYLSFNGGKLEVVYRSTEDDYQEAMGEIPEEYQTYRIKSIKSCPITWLEKLSSEKQIKSLLSNLEKSLVSIQNNTIGSIESLNKALESQSEDVSNESIVALQEFNADELIRSWLKARASIQSDPADSITRSSSYLESICRLILKETGAAPLKKQDITSLIGAAIKELNLSDDNEANNDLIQLFGGIKGICQAVGSMRTHFGTAHGFTIGDYAPQEHYARLVSDASATVSTYLLRRLKQKLNQKAQYSKQNS